MKKLLLYFFTFSLSLNLYSQQYENIVDTSKKWNILSTSYGFEQDEQYSTYSLTIGNETTINGLIYNEINGLYIREDVNNDVYLIHLGGIESKIYDFNLEIGQQIDLYNGGEYLTWNVINVEMVSIENIDRKKITLDYQGNQEIWYEGIGSSKGLIYSGYMPIDYDTSLLCYYQNNELLIQNGASCNVTNQPITNIIYFTSNTFTLNHFLINNTTIEEPDGAVDASFTATQGNTNNELNVFFGGMCENASSATILLNNDNTQTVLSGGGTTLGACDPNLYPNGDNQEGRFFNILSGNIALQPNNPLPIYYEKSTDGLTLTMWNFENEKLVFDVSERLGIDNYSFKNNFNFYPNPVTAILTISSSTITNYKIEIYTILGKRVLTDQSKSVVTKLDLSKITTGIYFVKISSDKSSFVFKLVKK